MPPLPRTPHSQICENTAGQPVRGEAIVPSRLAGRRVDQVAAELFDDYSRANLSAWIQSGELTVDGVAVKPKLRLFGGERLSLLATLTERENWTSAQPIPLEIVYEDADLLVVHKPAGLVVHPGAGNPDQTLVNGLLAYRPALRLVPRAGVVHRLDKETSGLLLVAGTLPAHQALVRSIAAREVERRYLALCEGRLVAGRTVDAPIGRDPRQRTRQAVMEDGRDARTHIRVLERFRTHTLIEAELETGRTHQIRVHLAHIGHPLAGDRRYGARGRLPNAPAPVLVERLQAFRRQALHAASLVLNHPISGEPLAFEAPLPADLEKLIDALRVDADAGS